MSLRVTVRVKPGASRAAVGGRYGSGALVVAVNARPVEGAANKAVIQALADAFGVRRADVTLVHGRTGRDKILDIAGDSSALAVRLQELLGP